MVSCLRVQTRYGFYMDIHVCYRFENGRDANRFLNELKHWSKHEVSAKLFKSECLVKISYELYGSEFNYASSDLDDLALKYNGKEE